MTKPVKGFLQKPKPHVSGKASRGRFIFTQVQWSQEGSDFATFQLTAEELEAAAASNIVWTDQDVQRGIKPGLPFKPPRELSLGDGYPDSSAYVFDSTKADQIAEKLLAGERVFLNPLVWNLRPGTFEAYWDKDSHEIYFYSGRVYLPDSHHRHQGIVKAVRAWRDQPSDYPKFSPNKAFNVELYFLSRDDEGNYFYDKNQRPWAAAKSKAYDLTTEDDLSVLAKKVIEKCSVLKENVNRVTDRLTASNPQLLTLSTLREMMRNFAGEDPVDSAELEGLSLVAASFLDLVAVVRPELTPLPLAERRKVRTRLIVDAAVVLHGLGALMRDFNEDLAKVGKADAEKKWRSRLGRIAASHTFKMGKWSGDLFEKANPLWQQVGVTKPGRKAGSITVLNTGGARAETARVLRQLLSTQAPQDDLSFLVTR